MAKKAANFSNDEEIWQLLKLISKERDESMNKTIKVLIKQEAERLDIKLSPAKKKN